MHVQAIEIHGLHLRDGREVDLASLLSLVAQWGRSLEWSITELEAQGDIRDLFAMDILELESLTTKGDSGYHVSWQVLLEFAQQVEQVIWGTFTGRDHTGAAVLALQSFDSSYWVVESTDTCSIEAVRREYQNVEVSPPTLLA